MYKFLYKYIYIYTDIKFTFNYLIILPQFNIFYSIGVLTGFIINRYLEFIKIISNIKIFMYLLYKIFNVFFFIIYYTNHQFSMLFI